MIAAVKPPGIPAFVVAIPARYASTRLPGKPLADIAGTPMVLHVARRALAAGATSVVVATDDDRVAQALLGSGVSIAMTRVEHVCGSDRLAETAEQLGWADDLIVINLQGDEPLVPVSGIVALAQLLQSSVAPMATLATPLTAAEALFDPNCVKVTRALNGDALYFSRAALPWARDAFAASRGALPEGIEFLRHIGIYAYRAGFLRRFSKLAPTPLERAESLEQLRALEHGFSIAVGIAPEPFPAGVDTLADLERVRAQLG